MSSRNETIHIATRGSALALAQSKMILAECQAAFPQWRFELKIIKTTGDKLQARPPSEPLMEAGKGLFTKELESALLNGNADLAVHSLKDLPTELPNGLALAAVGKREDVRDVLIYGLKKALHPEAREDTEKPGAAKTKRPTGHATIRDLREGATVATGSTRRQAQLLALRSDLNVVPVRGNVGTRLRKLAEKTELDATILAAAGLHRLGFAIAQDGRLQLRQAASSEVPEGLRAAYLPLEQMLPCVGQGAIGLEIRIGDERMAAICARLNDPATYQCVTAERAFLHAMGGGCLSPVAAHAEIIGDQLRIRAVSFRDHIERRGEARGGPNNAAALGAHVATELMRQSR